MVRLLILERLSLVCPMPALICSCPPSPTAVVQRLKEAAEAQVGWLLSCAVMPCLSSWGAVERSLPVEGRSALVQRIGSS